MTVRNVAGVTRGAGFAGWPLLPSPVVEESQPRIAAVPPSAPAPAPEVDDLVAVAAALNGPGGVVYIDHRPQHAA